MKLKYIFCISTGRCGTDYLAGLLSSLRNSEVHHEHKPLLHNEYMRKYLKGDKVPLQEGFVDKLKLITSVEKEFYVDTSHIFIKGFGWEIPKHISQEEIGVIILKRDKEKTVQSTFRVQSGPFRYHGRKWIIVPNGKNLLKPPVSYFWYTLYRVLLKLYWKLKGEDKKMDRTYPKFFKRKAIELIRWYYDETYALGENYKIQFPNITYVDVNLEELNSTEGVMKLVSAFKLNEHLDIDALHDRIGKPKNLKQHFS